MIKTFSKILKHSYIPKTNTLSIPTIKARNNNGDIFEIPTQIKSFVLVYIGIPDHDFVTVARYLKKYYEYDKISTLHIDTSKSNQNLTLNNSFFTASKMEINKLISFKNKYQSDYFLVTPNNKVETSFKKPLNTVRKLQQIRLVINSN